VIAREATQKSINALIRAETVVGNMPAQIAIESLIAIGVGWSVIAAQLREYEALDEIKAGLAKPVAKQS